MTTTDTHIMTINGILSPDVVDHLFLFAFDAMDAIGRETCDPGMSLTQLHLSDSPSWTGDWSEDSLDAVGYGVQSTHAMVFDGVSAAITHYIDKYPAISVGEMVDTGYLFQKYKTETGFHADRFDVRVVDRGLLTVIFFLNDVVGGEVVFDNFGISVEPRAGRAVVFPAHWTILYRSEPPRGNDKYTITTTLHVG